MQAPNFDEMVEKILLADFRYHRNAYGFVREALDYTQKMINKSKSQEGGALAVRVQEDKPHHVTGQQLLEGIRRYALKQFGAMTIMVFEEWGVRRCEDFGEIVFNMVESNLLAKTRKDSREDFRSGYNFLEAFRKPFLPERLRTAPAPGTENKPTKV